MKHVTDELAPAREHPDPIEAAWQVRLSVWAGIDERLGSLIVQTLTHMSKPDDKPNDLEARMKCASALTALMKGKRETQAHLFELERRLLGALPASAKAALKPGHDQDADQDIDVDVDDMPAQVIKALLSARAAMGDDEETLAQRAQILRCDLARLKDKA